LLIESLENWVITPEIMPNLYSLTKSNNILYAPRITSQALKGTSADGQMIVLTGLLPIKNGATCFRYSDNTYPSIVKNFPKIVNLQIFTFFKFLTKIDFCYQLCYQLC
jgi:phosphoglycerol transferase MdoB-like AlkP superfamily enzyme